MNRFLSFARFDVRNEPDWSCGQIICVNDSVWITRHRKCFQEHRSDPVFYSTHASCPVDTRDFGTDVSHPLWTSQPGQSFVAEFSWECTFHQLQDWPRLLLYPYGRGSHFLFALGTNSTFWLWQLAVWLEQDMEKSMDASRIYSTLLVQLASGAKESSIAIVFFYVSKDSRIWSPWGGSSPARTGIYISPSLLARSLRW